MLLTFTGLDAEKLTAGGHHESNETSESVKMEDNQSPVAQEQTSLFCNNERYLEKKVSFSKVWQRSDTWKTIVASIPYLNRLIDVE